MSYPLLSPAPENPLLRLDLRSGVGTEELIGLAIVFCLLLGHAVFTDLFRNKTIKDVSSLGLFFAAVAAMPLIYAHPLRQLFWAIGIIVGIFVLWFAGAIADGDFKIYSAYAFLLGPAAIPAIFISWVLVIVYSVPIMAETIKKRRRSGEKAKRGMRLGVAPAGPGIAFALPLTVWAAGAEAKTALLIAAGIALSAVLAAGWVTLQERAEAKEAESSSSG